MVSGLYSSRMCCLLHVQSIIIHFLTYCGLWLMDIRTNTPVCNARAYVEICFKVLHISLTTYQLLATLRSTFHCNVKEQPLHSKTYHLLSTPGPSLTYIKRRMFSDCKLFLLVSRVVIPQSN